MKNFLLLISVSILLFGCYKDIDNSKPTETIIEVPEVFVTTSIAGHVLGLDGEKISNYDITINDKTYSIEGTDFLLNIEKLKQNGQTIHVHKDGAYVGFVTALLVENDINQVYVQALPKWNSILTQSNKRSIQTESYILDLGKAEFVDGNEEAYTGEVIIENGLISHENKLSNIAYSSESDVLVIATLGGFYINSLDSEGKLLSLKRTSHMDVNIESIPEEATAIFYFDELNEIWIKVLDLVDASDKDISIFKSGYYLFAKHEKGVFVSGNVEYSFKPVSYQQLSWKFSPLNVDYYSSMRGSWITVMPENSELKISMMNSCGEDIQTEPIVIGGVDVMEKIIIVVENEDQYKLLTLKVIDCDGNMVDDPSFQIKDNHVFHFEGEEINTYFAIGCDDWRIAAIANDLTTGPHVDMSNSSSENMKVLTNCDDHKDGYSYIKINGDQKIYNAFEIVEEDGRTIFQSKDGSMKLFVKGSANRIYTEKEINLFINDDNFDGVGYFMNCDNSEVGCGVSECNISQYEENDWTILSFEGEVWIQNLETNKADTKTIEGVITIKAH